MRMRPFAGNAAVKGVTLKACSSKKRHLCFKVTFLKSGIYNCNNVKLRSTQMDSQQQWDGGVSKRCSETWNCFKVIGLGVIFPSFPKLSCNLKKCLSTVNLLFGLKSSCASCMLMKPLGGKENVMRFLGEKIFAHSSIVNHTRCFSSRK